MKTILVTAYAVNPYKGSEDGMGWNFILQIARYNKVLAVTRINNGPHIDQYKTEHPELAILLENIRFMYFDWPYWARFWKKGPTLSLIYFYGWQLTLPFYLLLRRVQADIVHNLNFHNDWTPSFLWLLGKPFIWGPVGHHPRIPKDFIRKQYGKGEYIKDRLLWGLKNIFWYCDPFLRIAAARASKVLCMNSEASIKLGLGTEKAIVIPSVASENVNMPQQREAGKFTVLSVGRFVPLKGFDLTIRSFAKFYKRLPTASRPGVRLILVGTGPALPKLKNIISEENIVEAVDIIEWMPREKLKSLYGACHAFLFPSHEGAGMVVAEAFSYGVPVVCLDNVGPGEFQHPQSALKVPYSTYQDTTEGLAKKLSTLHEDPGFYRLEQALAIERFSNFFEWTIRGNQLKKVYDSIQTDTYSSAIQDIIPKLNKIG